MHKHLARYDRAGRPGAAGERCADRRVVGRHTVLQQCQAGQCGHTELMLVHEVELPDPSSPCDRLRKSLCARSPVQPQRRWDFYIVRVLRVARHGSAPETGQDKPA